jgi:hypothetical protein
MVLEETFVVILIKLERLVFLISKPLKGKDK